MECRFTYPNGKRCRCRATAGHVFCRQHAPQPPVPTLRNRATPFRTWQAVRRHLATLDRAEIPPSILLVLNALLKEGPSGISDRGAGELLRALVRRFGGVPFTLPDDPEPEPDYNFMLSESIDRVAEIIIRRTGQTPPRMPSCSPLKEGEGWRKGGSNEVVNVGWLSEGNPQLPPFQPLQNQEPSRSTTQGVGVSH